MVLGNGEPESYTEKTLREIDQALALGACAMQSYEATRSAQLNSAISSLCGIEVEVTEPIVLKKPNFEFGIQQEDGSTAYVRIWDGGYEINGHFVVDSEEHELDLLKIFIANQGKPMLDVSILRNENFLPGADEKLKKRFLNRTTRRFNYYSGESGLFISGELRDKSRDFFNNLLQGW